LLFFLTHIRVSLKNKEPHFLLLKQTALRFPWQSTLSRPLRLRPPLPTQRHPPIRPLTLRFLTVIDFPSFPIKFCILYLQSRIVMADANQAPPKSAPEFQEDSRASIIDLDSTDSTELWLIQWPKDQVPDFDGQQLSLDLNQDDGQLGTFEASSGKSYDVVSFASQEPKATVFLSSAADSKILGKITRRVSFVHYLEPGDVPKDDTKRLKQLYERSSATSLTNSTYKFATPTKSIRPIPSSGRASTHSSGHKSSLSEEKVRHKPSRSGQSSDHSEEKKARKKKKEVA
ncbi:hypothetical protein M8C21_033633, partial [Ambrosia artemisiifolia]